jgi:hypothetical protein
LVQHAGSLEPGQIKSIADPASADLITGCVAKLAPPETGVLRVNTRNNHRAVSFYFHLSGRRAGPRVRIPKVVSLQRPLGAHPEGP